MKSHQKFLTSVLILMIFSVATASADVVQLKNGDRISGKIIRMEEDKLVFKTKYAGEINIAWQQVAGISTDEKIKVVLDDGTALEGNTLAPEAGRMELKTEKLEEPSAFDLAAVKTINPQVKPAVKVTARANLGLITESGNSDTDNFRVDGRFTARTEKSRYGAGGELNREANNGIDTVRNWLVFANYDYFFKEKWFAYFLTQLKNDDFADLDLRTTLGVGVGYQVFESDTLNLSFGAGPSYVDENFNLAPDDSFAAGQWVIDYDQYFYNKLFQLFHLSSGYVSLDDSEDWVLYTRQGIRFPIYRGLTATLQYSYDYDNNPSPGANADYDSKLSFLLGYAFGN